MSWRQGYNGCESCDWLPLLFSLIDAENNFVKYGKDRVDSLNSPYDFSSIMHYNATTFAKPGSNAIETIDPTKQKLIGQRIRLSKEDIFQINKLYKCGGNYYFLFFLNMFLAERGNCNS